MQGKPLCEAFYHRAVAPILAAHFPAMPYAAAHIGYGSDVLGYDDALSQDHMWGPRCDLFVPTVGDVPRVQAVLRAHLPHWFMGYAVDFSQPGPGGGVRVPEPAESGPVRSLIWVHTLGEYFQRYLGCADPAALTPAGWLSLSEHRLLATACGTVFFDNLGLREALVGLAAYPEPVRTYLLASHWSLIAEEQAFPQRCGDRGDDLGARLIAARIADRVMRLCFGYLGRYAPYSKWLGTAFAALPVDPAIGRALDRALRAGDASARQRALVEAQSLVGALHNASGLTEPLDLSVRDYYGRGIPVLFADRFAQALAARLIGTELEGVPLIGALSQVANLTALTDQPAHRARVAALYGRGES